MRPPTTSVDAEKARPSAAPPVGEAEDGPPEERPDGGIGNEDGRERRNRELIELLNELRVALPGVQVLFAFLLTVPFSGRFDSLTRMQQLAYFGTFAGTAIATALFMAPTSYHRIRFRQGDKERMLRTANTFTIAGIGFLAMSMAGAVFLIADLVFGPAAAVGLAAAILALLVWTWFLLPLSRRMRDGA